MNFGGRGRNRLGESGIGVVGDGGEGKTGGRPAARNHRQGGGFQSSKLGGETYGQGVDG